MTSIDSVVCTLVQSVSPSPVFYNKLHLGWNNMHYWRVYYLEQHFIQKQIAVKESWWDELLTTILCLHNPPTLTEQCKNTIWLLCKVKSVVVDIFLGWWPPSNGHWIGSYRQQWKRRGNCISFDRNNRIWSSVLDWILVILFNCSSSQLQGFEIRYRVT